MFKTTVFAFAAMVSIGLGSTTVSAVTLLEDDFTSGTLDPAWVPSPASGGWDVGSIAGDNRLFSNKLTSDTSSHRISRALSTSASSGWSVSLRYGWFNYSGHSGARITFGMRDASGNEYLVYLQQNGYVEIDRYDAGVFGGFFTTAPKTNDAGIVSSGGDYRPIRLDWDPGTGLSVYIGNPGDAAGTASTLLGTWNDTTHSAVAFTEFELRDRSLNDARATFDDILITVIPEPASLALLFAGGVLALFKRRTCQL